MNRIAVAGLVCLLVSASAFADARQTHSPGTATSASPKITLEQIMADPDWIGPPVEDAYWSIDGRSIYFKLKRKGSRIRALYRVSATGGGPVKLSDAQVASADGRRVSWAEGDDWYVWDADTGLVSLVGDKH